MAWELMFNDEIVGVAGPTDTFRIVTYTAPRQVFVFRNITPPGVGSRAIVWVEVDVDSVSAVSTLTCQLDGTLVSVPVTVADTDGNRKKILFTSDGWLRKPIRHLQIGETPATLVNPTFKVKVGYWV